MPTYEYKCTCSDDIISFDRKITDDEPTYICEKCNAKLGRHFGTFGINLKGSGFYSTDNRK